MTTDSTHEAPIVPEEASAEIKDTLRAAWLLRRNLEDGDKRMAIENCNAIISLLETGKQPSDIPSARALADAITARLSTPSAPPADVEAESRELLAAEYDRLGEEASAAAVRATRYETEGPTGFYATALRAIQRALSARQIAPPSEEVAAMVERLWKAAASSSDIHRQMAEAKSLRQEGHNPPRKDLYMWQTPEQTLEGQAAALITRLSGGEVERLREALEPFSTALGDIAGPDKTRWPDHETIEHSGAAELITWGDLRRARAALPPKEPQP